MNGHIYYCLQMLQIVTIIDLLTTCTINSKTQKNCSRLCSIFNFIFQRFSDNIVWHFKLIVCLGGDSHEISSLVFSEK